MRKYLTILVCLIGSFLYAQERASYGLKILAMPESELSEELSYEEAFSDSLTRHQAVQTYLGDLYSNGYLAASFDSLHYDTIKLAAYINQGKVYNWAHIDASQVDEGVLSRIGYRDKLYQNKPFNRLQLRSLQESILVHYENNGYPFTVVKLSDVGIEDENISATLNVRTNMMYKIDSVEIVGEANISPIYLYSYLGLSQVIFTMNA